MGSVNIGTVRTFPNVEPDKAQALKPLEEAAEVFGAWQNASAGMPLSREEIAFEIADCITACANLAAALGIEDLGPHLRAAEALNEFRGRYEA